MKKILAVALLALLVVGMFVSCDDSAVGTVFDDRGSNIYFYTSGSSKSLSGNSSYTEHVYAVPGGVLAETIVNRALETLGITSDEVLGVRLERIIKIAMDGEGPFTSLSNLDEFEADGDLKELPSHVFENASNLSTVVANGVNKIGKGAFKGCSKLDDASFISCTFIGDEAFLDCFPTGGTIAFGTVPPSLEGIPFDSSTAMDYNPNNIIHFNIPQGTEEKYQNADGWAGKGSSEAQLETRHRIYWHVGEFTYDEANRKYVPEAGEDATINVTQKINSLLSIPALPSIYGYSATGWYTDNTYSTSVTSVTLSATPERHDYYADFKPIQSTSTDTSPTDTTTPTYIVLFNSNGGSEVTSQTVLKGEKATTPTDPTKDGFDFDKWYSNEALTTEYDFDTPVTANITLYAKWNSIPLKFVAQENGVIIRLDCDTYAEDFPIQLKYSTDGVWHDYSWSDYYGLDIPLDTGDAVYFKASTSNNSFANSDYHYYFAIENGKVASEGNIMYLLDSTGESLTVPNYAFYQLFEDCENLISAPSLPATTLGEYCYAEMFSGTGLTTAPELPATELASYCYYDMFDDCESLTTAPELPASELVPYCYQYMFGGCVNLETAPELPATTLAEYCYDNMFYGCENLKTAPELPATELAPYCYSYMFIDCESLETAPELPATTLAEYCYNGMFQGCISLTQAPELPETELEVGCYCGMFWGCESLETAPELPATTLVTECYRGMFGFCSSLNSVTVHFTDWNVANDSTYEWFYDASTTGIFTCPATLHSAGPISTGGTISTILNGWTIVNL